MIYCYLMTIFIVEQDRTVSRRRKPVENEETGVNGIYLFIISQ